MSRKARPAPSIDLPGELATLERDRARLVSERARLIDALNQATTAVIRIEGAIQQMNRILKRPDTRVDPMQAPHAVPR